MQISLLHDDDDDDDDDDDVTVPQSKQQAPRYEGVACSNMCVYRIKLTLLDGTANDDEKTYNEHFELLMCDV
jgi:hypothetical protein